MSKKNLPIKLVLPKTIDIVPANPGGNVKFSGKVTSQMKAKKTNRSESLLFICNLIICIYFCLRLIWIIAESL